MRGLSLVAASGGPPFIALRGPLIIAASLVAEHRLQTRRLSNCGSRSQLLRGMWDLPRPGHEPVSPALAGRLPTSAPPGKPEHLFIFLLAVYISLVKCLFISFDHLKIGLFVFVLLRFEFFMYSRYMSLSDI